MPRPVLLVLGAAALVAAPFAYGFVRALVDPDFAARIAEERAEREAARAPAATPADADPVPREAALGEPVPGDAPRPPADLAPDQVDDWLLAERLLAVRDGAVVGDVARLAALDPADAARLVLLARADADGAPSERRPAARALAATLFAWLSCLPTDARRALCDAVGAVHPTDDVRGYLGPFTSLLHYQDAGPDSIFALAVQRYAAVLSDREVVDALKDFRVIDEALGDDSRWFLHVEERMQDFAPATLLALRDAISGYTGLGDRKYLRAQLKALAEHEASTSER